MQREVGHLVGNHCTAPSVSPPTGLRPSEVKQTWTEPVFVSVKPVFPPQNLHSFLSRSNHLETLDLSNSDVSLEQVNAGCRLQLRLSASAANAAACVSGVCVSSQRIAEAPLCPQHVKDPVLSQVRGQPFDQYLRASKASWKQLLDAACVSCGRTDSAIY